MWGVQRIEIGSREPISIRREEKMARVLKTFDLQA